MSDSKAKGMPNSTGQETDDVRCSCRSGYDGQFKLSISAEAPAASQSRGACCRSDDDSWIETAETAGRTEPTIQPYEHLGPNNRSLGIRYGGSRAGLLDSFANGSEHQDLLC